MWRGPIEYRHWCRLIKKSKARESGKKEFEKQLKTSIQNIEEIISEIIESRFQFDFSCETISVRANINGEILDLQFLPDGLKSILSWVADLLMRLDRIPWLMTLPRWNVPFCSFWMK